MLVPIRVSTLTIRSPWVNLTIFALNILCFILAVTGVMSDEVWADHFVLTGWSTPSGFIGSMFMHAGIMHLIGNMIFLWVFGNALNGVMHDLDYALAYLASGILAGALHLVIDGHPAVGASGAISGLLGLFLAVYPQNTITCFYWFFGFGTFDIRGYWLIIGWFLWDLGSAIMGDSEIACWAHVGGMVAGFVIGMVLLKMQRIYLGDYDNATVFDLIARRSSAES